MRDFAFTLSGICAAAVAWGHNDVAVWSGAIGATLLVAHHLTNHFGGAR